MKLVATLAALVALVLILRALATRGEAYGSSTPGAVPSALTDDSVRELLLRGRKIEAIKAYRKLHGVDLKEAKRAVELLAERLPPARGAA